MLHRLRSVLVRPGRERLAGDVEVDEGYFGGEEPGLRGGRQRGKKVLVGIAVERTEPKGFGRCRMAPLLDASADGLRAFLADSVEPRAKVRRLAGLRAGDGGKLPWSPAEPGPAAGRASLAAHQLGRLNGYPTSPQALAPGPEARADGSGDSIW